MKVLRELNLKNIVFIDIETASIVEELELDTPLFDSWAYSSSRRDFSNDELILSYKDQAALQPEFGRIVCISVGRIVGDKLKIRTYNNQNEKVMLQDFNDDLEMVTDANPKIVFCGHAAIGFDIPFIFKRCLVNQVEPHYLIDTSGQKPWEVKTIDTKDLWKNTSWKPVSLINISVALGISSPKDDISGADVGRVFWTEGEKGIQRISRYCEKDVLTTANVVMRCRFEPLLEMDLSGVEIPVEEIPLIRKLFDGGKYGAEEKKEMKALLKTLSKEDKVKALVILESIVSGAKGKKTKITKAHVKALRDGK